jgi:tetratricopeptide (TPR) repeat protein
MRSSTSASRRGLGIVCLVLGTLGAAREAFAQDSAAASAHRVSVADGVIPESLEAARAGLVERVRLRLGTVGVPTGAAVTPRAAAGAPGSCARAAAGAPADATELVLVDLRPARVGLDVALRVYARASCELAIAARAHGDAAQLGVALDAALARIVPHLDGAPESLGSAPAMSVEQLAAEGRALEAVAGDELARAWRAVDGDESPLAQALRARIETRSVAPDFSAAERIRLRIARGEETSGDVATRKLLTDAARALDAPDRPMDARLALAAGEIRLARGDAEAAKPYLEKAVALAAQNPDAQIAFGRSLALLGDDSHAQRAFERASELEPASGRALEELAQLQAHEPVRASALLLSAAERASRGLNLHQALSDFARAAQLDERSAAIERDRLGHLHAELGDPEQARASWRDAITSGGATQARLIGIARASRALGDGAAAEQALQQALELDPAAPGAARELGALYLETGRHEAARPLLERAIAQDGGDAAAKLELARLHVNAGEPDAALALLRAVELTRGTTPEQLELRAQILVASGDSAGARAALERAVELDPIDPTLRLALADRAQALGDAPSASLERERAALLADVSPAEAARGASPDTSADFAGIDESLVKLALSFGAVPADTGRVLFVGVRETPTLRDQALDFLRPKVPDLAKMERGLRRVFESQYALASPAELAKALDNVATAESLDRLYHFDSQRSLDASAAIELNLALGGDALFLARLERRPGPSAGTSVSCPSEAPWRLELRQLAGRTSRARILGNAVCLSPIAEEYLVWNPRAAALYGAFALLGLFAVLRGWGSVSVVVELPPQTRALFSISVSRRQRKTAQTKSLKSREKAKWRIEDGLRRMNRFERPLREGAPTSFHWIPARRRSYYVTVRGPLQNSDTGELIGDFLEEQLVRVRRGQKLTVRFDMRPKETPLEIQISGAAKGASHVAIALRGDPRSLRYVADAPVFLYVKPGRHVLLVGAGERLLERVVEVRSFDPVKVLFDVARETGAVFSGSAAAVSAYLEGDVSRAADELERAGQTQAATKLRADLLRARGDVAGASRALETAGDLRGAAELRATTEDRAGAAALFEAAEDFEKAGDAYRAAGDFASASRAYERAGELDDAIACCKQADDAERLLALYEKNSSYFEAGELAASLKQAARAIHNLTQVEASDSNYTAACRRLVELHIERGQLPNALERLDGLIEAQGDSDSALPLYAVKAELLEKLGRFDDALAAWEAIEARAPKFRDAAERAAALRAKRQPAPSAAAAEQAVDPVESRYEIQEELGRGAMGVVYKARDKHLGRIVALKRLTESLRGHPTAIAFFEREARAAAALNHANIVTVYDAGTEAGHYFITMEFLQGTTLDTILRARGAMAPPVAAALGMQVCAGLQYAHAARIIHRDIKTANLFYTRERTVKIMDFGLAKMVEEVRKGATVIGGTPFYMAPEQAAGENVDHRADLYALGVTLFELLTKTVPFRKGDVTFHHRNTPAPDPRERVAAIPAALAELVMKLMQKSPEARCQSAAEVAAVLQPIAAAV